MLHQIPHKAQPFIPSEPKSTTSLSYIFPFFKFSISFLIYKFLSSLLPSHTHFPFHSPLIQIMDFLQAPENQILVGVAVAVVAIGLGAVYLYSSKKTKGFTFFNFMLYPFEILCFYFDLCIRVFFFLVLHVREDPTCFFFLYENSM